MLFYTLPFFVFFIILTGLMCVLERYDYRKIVLLIASCVFYMWWNPIFILLLLFSIVLNYLVGLGLGKTDRVLWRRLLLVASLAGNFGILAFFKYANFIQDNTLVILKMLGYHPSWTTLNIILPIGISFFTFQGMSYTIDVYRHKLGICRSFLDFALFKAFFPQLVAGPIVRATLFLPQLDRPNKLCFDRRAFALFIRGLAKKVIIANNVAYFADFVFASPQLHGSLMIWLATFAFYVQIYCDFSGYSDMAIAVARMLGYHIPVNFRRPYFALSPADFWRRWHISLSTWLRDYLYIPLGGSRKGTLFTYRNLMITMLLGGLWHGASWNFVLWGGMHGVALVVHKLYVQVKEKYIGVGALDENPVYRFFCFLLCQYWILLTWIPFRVLNTNDMLFAMKKFVFFDFAVDIADKGLGEARLFSTVLILAAFYLVHTWSQFRKGLDIRLAKMPVHAAFVACVVFGFVLFFLWPSKAVPFIYFQF